MIRRILRACSLPLRSGAALLCGVWLASHAGNALAQAPDGAMPFATDYTLPFEDASAAATGGGRLNERDAGGYGFKGRAGHEAGETVGRKQSITYFDLAPYVFVDNNILFGEGRLAIGNNGRVGGSVGAGARHFFDDWNFIVGTNFFYDADSTRAAHFQQWGFGGEILTEWLDWRGNFYFPTGSRDQILGSNFLPGTQQFVDATDGIGSNIQFQRLTRTASSMQGFDSMFSVPIPGEIPQKFNLEASAGFYYYDPQADLEQIWGWKVRTDADVFDRLGHMYLEVMHDEVFKTNVVFGIDINYWHKLESRPRLGRSQFSRMAEWVRRNRTVVVQETAFVEDPELAINPNTGNPYLVYHVRNVLDPPPPNFPPPTGNGTLDRPFQFIQDAIDAGPNADIVFVQGNSVFDGDDLGNAAGTITLRDGLLLLGEGVEHRIPVQQLSGTILVPTVTPGAVARPVIRDIDVSGTAAITLADGSRFAGFDLINIANGPAIRATNTVGSTVNQVRINGVTGVDGHGVQLTNNTGLFSFDTVSIAGAEGTGFLVEGGNANIVFQNQNNIDNSTGFAVRIFDAGGNVNFANTTITDNGGQGVFVGASAPGQSTANVTFTTTNLSNNTGGAVQILTHSGQVAFAGPLTINNTLGGAASIRISDLQPTGTVTSTGAIVINNRSGSGILVENIVEGPSPTTGGPIAGSVNFQNTVLIDNVVGNLTDPAVLFNSYSGVLRFGNFLTIDESNGAGILITNPGADDGSVTTGRFIATQNISISDTVGPAFQITGIDKNNFVVQTNSLDIDDRSSIGIEITGFDGSANFAGITTVDNQNNSLANAILIANNNGDVAFGAVLVDNARGLFGVRVINNVDTEDPNGESRISFGSLSVEAIGTEANPITAVSMINNQRVSTGGGSIEATNGTGIEVIHDATVNRQGNVIAFQAGRHDLIFNDISAADSDFGIYVDGPGSFIVDGGPSAIVGSGGTIEDMSVDGARFQNTTRVRLGFMEFEDNFRGVAGINILEEAFGINPEFTLQGVEIDGSAREGLFLRDVLLIQMSDSIVTDNGRGGAGPLPPVANRQQIDIVQSTSRVDSNNDGVVDDNDDILTYIINFDNNRIEDANGAAIAGADMIFIGTANSINDPVNLLFTFTNHGNPVTGISNVNSNRTGQAALNLDWEGDVVATIVNNSFRLINGNAAVRGEDQTGLLFNIEGQADVLFQNNALTADGLANVGLDWTFEDSAVVRIIDNTVLDVNGNFVQNSGFVFNGQDSVAMNLNFESNNNAIDVSGNRIDFSAVNGTGIFFQRIFGPSVAIIEQNLISFPTQVGGQVRGIFFQDVRGTITLQGNVDNQVGALSLFGIDFFIPNNTSNGSIIVNGTQRP